MADSKFFAGETMALAAEHRFRFVTLVPQTVGLRRELVAASALEALPLLWERPGRRKGETEHYHGVSVVRSYRWKTAAGELQELPLRFLVIESTQLAKANALWAAAAQQAEWAALATFERQWQRQTFACEADAHQAATLCLRGLSVHSHHLTYTVGTAWVADKRPTRGRPPKEAPRPQRPVWRVTWQVHEATEVITARTRQDSRFVLATNVLEADHPSDADLLQAYKGQPAAELSFQGAKNPAAMAPIFLKTPSRIAALGCVYVIALLVHTWSSGACARTWRNGGNPARSPAPSQHPAARVVFHVMRHMAVVTLQWAGRSPRHVTTLNSHQLHVIRLLGYEASIYALPRRKSG